MEPVVLFIKRFIILALRNNGFSKRLIHVIFIILRIFILFPERVIFSRCYYFFLIFNIFILVNLGYTYRWFLSFIFPVRVLLVTACFIHLDTYLLFISQSLVLLITFVFLCHKSAPARSFFIIWKLRILFSIFLILFAVSIWVFRLLISLINSPAFNLRFDIKHLLNQELQNFVLVLRFQFFYLLQSLNLYKLSHVCLPTWAVL
jgi:hypothetical protein